METRYGRKLTLEIKPDTDNSTFNKNIWHILPVPLKPETINSALRHQCRYVIQLKIIIILITTFHSVRVTNKPQSVSNAAYNFPGSYSATGIRNWATQQTWLDWFFGFVSLAVQRLPKVLFPHFQCRVFYCRAIYQRPLNTQHCIYMSLQKLIYDCEIVHSVHIQS